MQTSPEICELSDAIRTVESKQEIIDSLVEALEGLLNEAHMASKGLHNNSVWSNKARAALAKTKE